MNTPKHLLLIMFLALHESVSGSAVMRFPLSKAITPAKMLMNMNKLPPILNSSVEPIQQSLPITKPQIPALKTPLLGTKTPLLGTAKTPLLAPNALGQYNQFKLNPLGLNSKKLLDSSAHEISEDENLEDEIENNEMFDADEIWEDKRKLDEIWDGSQEKDLETQNFSIDTVYKENLSDPSQKTVNPLHLNKKIPAPRKRGITANPNAEIPLGNKAHWQQTMMNDSSKNQKRENLLTHSRFRK